MHRKLEDPRLPGLAVALDPAALLDELARRLPERRGGAALEGARVAGVQYAPLHRARVELTLAVRASGQDDARHQLVTVHVLPPGDLAGHVATDLNVPASALARYAKRDAPLRTPVLPVPELGLVLHAFPVDAALPTLPDATDPEALREALDGAGPLRRRLGLDDGRVESARCDVVAYTPTSRAVLALEWEVERAGSDEPERRRAVAKLHARLPARRALARHRAVWRAAHRRVGLARPLGRLDALDLVLQEHVAGARLSSLAGRRGFRRAVRRTARALGAVHGLSLPGLAPRTPEAEARAVQRWAAVLAAVLPDRASRTARLADRLASEVAARTRVAGPVHADLHAGNVLARADGVTLLDWDQLAAGDPLGDVGRLAASLRVSALRVTGDAEGLAVARDELLSTYLAARGSRARDERRARLFEAAALFVAAAGPFRRQRQGWEGTAETLLDASERALERSGA